MSIIRNLKIKKMSNKVRLKSRHNPSVLEYKVGKRFPLEKYLKLGEGAIAMFNDHSFDIILLINNLAKEEISELSSGPLTISLYKNQNVPFLILSNKHFCFDLTLKFCHVPHWEQDLWLGSEGSLVNIFTVDSKNGVLQSIRSFGLQFVEEIREILKRQTRMSTIDVDSIISENMARLSAYQMLNLSSASQTLSSFKPSEGEQDFQIIMI